MGERNAVILLSGGMDSATVLAQATSDGFKCYCLSVFYGQVHPAELEAAKRVAARFHAADHQIAAVDLGIFGGSALTDATIPIPREGRRDGVPVTYVPARNTILLSLALAWAETLKADAIFIGVNAVDYAGYPDCRAEFIQAYEQLANVGTCAKMEGRNVRIYAPLQYLSKADIVRLGTQLGVDFSETVSCYGADSEGYACGLCDACRLRKKGFEEAGISDTTRYVGTSLLI